MSRPLEWQCYRQVGRQEIEYIYNYAIDARNIGEATKIVAEHDGNCVTFEIAAGSCD